MESVPLSFVVAYIQPFQLDTVVDALRALPGCPGMTVSEVRGFGCARAHPPREGEKAEVDPFERRLRIEILCRPADEPHHPPRLPSERRRGFPFRTTGLILPGVAVLAGLGWMPSGWELAAHHFVTTDTPTPQPEASFFARLAPGAPEASMTATRLEIRVRNLNCEHDARAIQTGLEGFAGLASLRILFVRKTGNSPSGGSWTLHRTGLMP